MVPFLDPNGIRAIPGDPQESRSASSRSQLAEQWLLARSGPLAALSPTSSEPTGRRRGTLRLRSRAAADSCDRTYGPMIASIDFLTQGGDTSASPAALPVY